VKSSAVKSSDPRLSVPAVEPTRLFVQTSLDELDEPLRTTTFTVVDLETTGGAPGTDAITEIGAVKVRAGEVLGEFQTLVDPGQLISGFVSVLTGITDSMVSTAPPIGAVIGSFLEFARGSVLVAHNAPFDIGFLRAACAAHGHSWPAFAVVDTAVLARRVLTRDEVPNCKLSTLARHFQAQTEPIHRALADARATVDVLHALIARVGSLGVQSLPELRAFTAQVTDAQRRKRHLADPLPSGPGVYVFRDAQGHPLYVGTSRNLRARVRQYFLASETRSRMGEMISLADRVDPIECAHTLEAQVRELRLIAAHKPRYNRRSKFPERSVWLKLTDEAFPRLSIVRDVGSINVRPGSVLGPIGSRRQAEVIRDAIHDALPLRQCTDRLSIKRAVRAACLLAGIGRCAAPCESADVLADYTQLVDVLRASWLGDVDPLVAPLRRRMSELAEAHRFEQAGAVRDRLASLVRACARMQRISALTAIAELVAARPDGDGGWELSIIAHGRLAAAGLAPRGIAPMPVIEALRATAEVVVPRPGPLPAALAEETEVILRWLEERGTRLVWASQPWQQPARGAARFSGLLAATTPGNPFADRRRLPMQARPAR
jgi:DNA polymerase-3 subunit epsilon